LMSYGEDEGQRNYVAVQQERTRCCRHHFWHGNACRFQRYGRWPKQRW
jgi:hypothetical protein